MYKDEIRDKFKEKREANLYMFNDFLMIYIKLLLLFPEKNKIKIFREKIKEYIMYNYYENQIMKYILNNFSNQQDIDEIEEILDELESIFENVYKCYQQVFNNYEEMIEFKESYRGEIKYLEVELLDEKKTELYIEKLKKLSR